MTLQPLPSQRSSRSALSTALRGIPLPAGLAATALALLVALATPAASLLLLAGVAAGLLVLIRPWLGLLFLAVAIPFAAVKPLPVGPLFVNATDLLLALVVAAWLMQAGARRQIAIPRPALLLPLALFVLTVALSLPGGLSYRDGLLELAKWIQVLALYLCTAAVLPPGRAGWLLAALLAAGALQALLGLFQFVTQTGPEAFILLGRFMRASGTFRQPNPYAGYLGLIAPLAISLALWAWMPAAGRPGTAGPLAVPGSAPQAGYRQRAAPPVRSPWPRRWLRLGTTVAAGLTTAGLVVSWSRGGWIAFAVAFLVVILAHARRAAPLVLLATGLGLAAMAALGLADLLPASLVERLGELRSYLGMIDLRATEVTDANFSVLERVAHWQAASAMWAGHPWLGVGLGSYAAAYPAYALPRWPEALGHAHNVYLNFGAEAGLAGLLAYLVLWAAACWQALKSAASRHPLVAAVGAGVLGALAHATIHNMFDNLWVQHIALVLSLQLGLLAVLVKDQARVRNV